MAQLSYVATMSHAVPEVVTAITDLDLFVTSSGQAALYATSRSGEAITVFGLGPDGSAQLIDTQYLSEDTISLELMEFGGTLRAVTLGPAMDGPISFRIAADGTIGGVPQTLSSMAASEGFSDLVLTESASGTYVYAGDKAEGTIKAYAVQPDGELLQQTQQDVPGGASRLMAAQAGSEKYLIAVTGDGDQVVSYEVVAGGALQIRGRAGAADGLGVAGISALAQATMPDGEYIVLASQGSSSLSVLRLNTDGSLVPVDHVLDDLSSRFQSVTSLELVTLADQVFVMAGGADDGMSLFQLLPGGRLLHHDTMADSFAASLENVSSIAATTRDGTLEIFAASHTETGITHLSYDPGAVSDTLLGSDGGDAITGTAAGEVISGGQGDDTLNGGTGNDILMDGTGADRLTGGAGRDVFVMTADGIDDTITDFDPAEDVLDLSAYQMFRNLDQITFQTTADGCILTFRNEVLRVISADQRPLDAADILVPELINLSRLPVGNLGGETVFAGSVEADFLNGNGVSNYMDGAGGDDLMCGMAGSDVLVGGSGSDSLFGGLGDDVLNGDDVDVGFDPVSAQVFRLYQATLDRAPDAAGHRGWTETLRDGQASLLQVIEGFMGSPEFQGRYGATDTTEFVTLMYENVLGRAPDPAGLQAWRDQLDSGALSRAEVVFGFSESQEFMGNTAAGALEFSQAGYRANWADEVFRLYQATLDRVPDPGGLLAWVGELAGGRPYLEVVSGFVNSSEFQGRYGATDNAEFVTLMYENVLGRAPDPAGLQGWRRLLDDGTLSREEVVRGFAESAEFRDNTGPDLSAWMRATFPGDRLEGGGGANAVFGGFGADSFVFDAGDGGTHEVVDLEAWDWVILDGFSYADAGAVLADLTQQGTDVLLADSGVTITFLDTDIADITTDIFQII
ncbi:DUF4214 domain-containing protein [Rhodophyticola porphyridii]|uniref:DUF4214 domain-containing protein n=1 Tax=Rhodophyticola porphyridii TaxID=1852017 RepID=UPI0035CF20BD